MQIIKDTGLHGKSGGAQWRDLRFGGSFLEMCFHRYSKQEHPFTAQRCGLIIPSPSRMVMI